MTPQALFVTPRTAARLLSCSPRTLRRWIALGRLPVKRIGPRTVRIPESAVRCLLDDYSPEVTA